MKPPRTRGDTRRAAQTALLLSAAFAGLLCPPTNAAPPTTGNWQLIWSDEFDSGPTPEFPNPANWGYENGYVRNNEHQYYTNELQNAYCQDGFLNVEAHKHPAGTYPSGGASGQDGSVSSASLISRNRVQHKFGYLEMRAKVETQPGTWGAWWTLGVNGEWPDNGECDIYEYYGGNLHFNVAWWKTGDPRWTARWDSVTQSVSGLGGSTWANQFHLWAMEWDTDQVKLYLDGVLYNTWNTSLDSGDSSIEGFQQAHYMIINQAIGGNAGGNTGSIVYPTSYVVDYVRWYQNFEGATPTNLDANGGDGQVSLSWDPVPDPSSTGVNIYRSSTPGTGYSQIATGVTGTTYLDSATNGNSVYYAITYTGSQGESDPSGEVSVFPRTTSNLALSKPVTADSFFNQTTYPASNAVDGNHVDNSSRWLSANSAYPHWFEVDLQSLQRIDGFAFWNGFDGYNDPPSDFQLQWWDGSNWQDATSVSGNLDATYQQSFSAIETDRVRLHMTAGPSNIVRLYELEVWSAPGGDTVPPATPTGLTTNPADNQVALDWDDNLEGDFQYYNVYRTTTPGSGYIQLAFGLGASAFLDTSATNGTTYYYAVSAVDSFSNESSVTAESGATPVEPPNIALNKPVMVDSVLSGNPGSNAVDGNNVDDSSRWVSENVPFPHWIEIDLQGTYNISKLKFWNGFNGYNRPIHDFVFQHWDGAGWVDIFSETGNSDPTYSRSFPQIEASRVRLYMTAASDNYARFYEIEVRGESLPDSVPPAAPTGLAATPGSNTVSLDWNDNAESDLSFYRVYRSTNPGGPHSLLASSGTTSAYTDSTAANGTTYHYVVTAVDSSGNESSFSSEVSATPDGSLSTTEFTATGETAVSGSVSGSLAQVNTSDNGYQSITEVSSGGKPSNRYSTLEHAWTFNISGASPILQVEAHHDTSSDGDDFAFEYSTDGSSYTPVLTVTKTADDDSLQTASLGSATGLVYIRVVDTDSTAGNNSDFNTVFVDRLTIQTSTGGGNQPPVWLTNPVIETNGMEVQPYSGSLADDVTDPESDPLTFNKLSGPAWLSVDSNGTLSGTPGSGDVGSNSFAVEVSDGSNNPVSATLEITVTGAGSATEVYVADIAMSSATSGGNRINAIATITILDDAGDPVSNATVNADWTGATTESVSGATDANGVVTLTSGKVKNGGTFTITIDNVTASGLTYNPSLNIETTDSITAN